MDTSFEMKVTKRNGIIEDIAFDKILKRIKKLGQEANIQLNYSSLAMKVIDQLYDKIKTTKIDELAKRTMCFFINSTSRLCYSFF